LTVTAPLSPQAKTRRIEINHAPLSAESREIEVEPQPQS
jgi:hypothetical protein